jgi:hypothetical protein
LPARGCGGLDHHENARIAVSLARSIRDHLSPTVEAGLPLLRRSRGAIVNALSVTAFAALPLIAADSVSKAAPPVALTEGFGSGDTAALVLSAIGRLFVAMAIS